MKKDTSDAAISCLLTTLALPFAIAWRGYVLSMLWLWFIVPTFKAPAMTIVPAIGLSQVVWFLTAQMPATKNDEKSPLERTVEWMSYTFFWPLFALGFGYIIHLFI